MAGYYPSVIVTLLVIYSNSMNVYCSTYNGDISVIKNNLLLEKQTPSSWQNTDWVCGQNDFAKEELCNEVRRQIIREQKREELQSLLDVDETRGPRVDAALVCRNKFVLGVKMTLPMYWCLARRYKKKVSGSGSSSASDIGVIDGFFCASSLRNIDRVFVFRPARGDVAPLAELNNCDGSQNVPSSSHTITEDLNKYRSGYNRP